MTQTAHQRFLWTILLAVIICMALRIQWLENNVNRKDSIVTETYQGHHIAALALYCPPQNGRPGYWHAEAYLTSKRDPTAADKYWSDSKYPTQKIASQEALELAHWPIDQVETR